MSLRDIIDSAHLQAILDKLEPTEESVWQSMCRNYSKRFHTPLPEVQRMEPDKVFYAVYSDQYSDIDAEEDLDMLYETILRIEDPSYVVEQNKEFDDYVSRIEEQEEERVSSKKSIMETVKEEYRKKAPPPPKEA